MLQNTANAISTTTSAPTAIASPMSLRLIVSSIHPARQFPERPRTTRNQQQPPARQSQPPQIVDDENDNQDTRDEAFEYWSSATGTWEALEKALAAGAVVNTAMREEEKPWPSRVAPPLANDKTAISNRSFSWYAMFEFKNNRWYFTGFTECCE